MTDEAQQTLIAVQDLDTHIGQLEHQKVTLAERRELEALESQLEANAKLSAQRRSERAVFSDRQAELEEQIQTLTSRRQAIEARMYADRSAAARDLQAMEAEVRHLTELRSALEESELEVMEAQEPVDEALAALLEERRTLEGSAGELRTAVGAGEAVIHAELSTITAERAELARQLPTDLADRYETLRARLGGTGAARLVGRRCSGCHLELASVEVERLKRLPPSEVVTCDQCGRILVRD
jgi:uncharacterized protein